MLSSTITPSLLLFLIGAVFSSPVPETASTEIIIPLDVIVLPGIPEWTTEEAAAPTKRDVQELEERDKSLSFLLSLDQTNALVLHNKARADRKVPAIGWDFSLQAAAQAYANQLASTGTFAHSPGSSRPGQGENLAFVSSSAPVVNPISLGVQAWINEKSFYSNQLIPDGPFAAYGHYTQVVWNTTTRLGVATATDGKGSWYTVARYSPAGNIAGRRPS